jgi:hypothetical protein
VLTFIKSLFQSLLIILTRPHPPLPIVATPTKPAPDKITVLAQLIESRTIAIGPLPTTGGVIHQVTKSQAVALAGIIVKSAAQNRVRLSQLQSLLDGESRDDAKAINPNRQDAKPGETAAQALDHEDVGIEQEDVTTAKGDPQFAKLTDSQIIDKLLDPLYGVDFAASILRNNLERARKDFAANPALAKLVPNGDPDILGFEAYNTGYEGAMAIALRDGVKGNWKYGVGAVDRANGWAALLDE